VPDIMLVVDRSKSMDDEISAGLTKWQALLSAVDATTQALQSKIDFGLTSYAAVGTDLCAPGAVLIEPASGTADAIKAKLTADGTGGATPTAASLRAVSAYLATTRAGHENHPPTVLLATDGAPNCNAALSLPCRCSVGTEMMCTLDEPRNCLDDMATYAAVDELVNRTPPVPVYVIGLPGTEAFTDVLSEMARRGGTARTSEPAYYAASDAAALSSALEEIVTGLISCTFTLSVAPELPRRVQVYIDDTEIAHTDDQSSGWAYASADNTSFELFGPACALLKDGQQHTVKATYGCFDVF